MYRLIAIALFIVAVTVSLCEDRDRKPTPAPSPRSPSPSPQSGVAKEAAVPVPTGWPPAVGPGESVELEKSLLTKNYYVVLDGSGSMAESRCSGNATKSRASKTALKEFASSVPDDANLGLLAFDQGGVGERVALGRRNRDLFMAKVEATGADRNTPLRDAITRGLQALEKQARRQLGYGEYHLVVVTDGEADEGQVPTSIVNHIVDETPVQLHTIGFCIGTQHSLNQPGRTIYKAADSPEELRKGLQQVLAESEDFVLDKFEKPLTR